MDKQKFISRIDNAVINALWEGSVEENVFIYVFIYGKSYNLYGYVFYQTFLINHIQIQKWRKK